MSEKTQRELDALKVVVQQVREQQVHTDRENVDSAEGCKGLLDNEGSLYWLFPARPAYDVDDGVKERIADGNALAHFFDSATDSFLYSMGHRTDDYAFEILYGCTPKLLRKIDDAGKAFAVKVIDKYAQFRGKGQAWPELMNNMAVEEHPDMTDQDPLSTVGAAYWSFFETIRKGTRCEWLGVFLGKCAYNWISVPLLACSVIKAAW